MNALVVQSILILVPAVLLCLPRVQGDCDPMDMEVAACGTTFSVSMTNISTDVDTLLANLCRVSTEYLACVDDACESSIPTAVQETLDSALGAFNATHCITEDNNNGSGNLAPFYLVPALSVIFLLMAHLELFG